MLNEPPNRNPSENQQVTLHIPSVSPVFTVILLMITLFFFVVGFTSNGTPMLRSLGIQGEAIYYDYQVFRLFTAIFITDLAIVPNRIIGIIMALMSLYTLYIVGTAMERLWGTLRFALVFVLGGISGILMSMMLVPVQLVHIDIYLVAFPNGVMALLGAELVYMTKHRKLYGLRGKMRRNYLMGVAVLNIILSAFSTQVDLFGVLGGLLGGVILAAYISPFHLPRPHPDEAGALLGEDVNPLRAKMVPVMLYISTLISMLIVSVILIGN